MVSKTLSITQALIFDMDGLMFDTERLGIDAYSRAGAEFGYEITSDFILQCIGRSARDTEQLFRNHFGADFPYPAVRQRRLEIAEQWIRSHGVPQKDGLPELMDTLDALRLPRAVATSTERVRAEPLLKAAQIFHRFDATVCGDEVASGKPAPDIFLLAAKKLGYPPAQCLVLEDSGPGIQAAHSAGIPAILIPDIKIPPPEISRLAFAVAASLREVPDFLGERS
ncbi:MAG TPA: HAD family phosphatase [Patescibacteria group bacterium]|nr:HAD family phosphatase [Patescibacteria group bacterium]